MTLSLLLVGLLGSIRLVPGLDVIYGDSVSFAETANCTKPRAELRFATNDQLVARWDGEEWREGPEFVNRTSPGESVTLKEATINDNGLFALVCPGEEETRTHLNVAAAREASVSAGGELSFPFMYKTSGATGEFKMERKGEEEPVLKLNFASGTVTIRPGFQDRLSLPSNWKTHGNLTVTMRQVTEKDQGDFFLYVMDGGKKKQLSAWRVKVAAEKSTTTPPPGPTGGSLETGIGIGLGIGLSIGLLFGAVITGLACCFCDKRLKSLKSNLSCRGAQNDEEQGANHVEAPADEEQGSGGEEGQEDLPLQNMQGHRANHECNGNLGSVKAKSESESEKGLLPGIVNTIRGICCGGLVQQ